MRLSDAMVLGSTLLKHVSFCSPKTNKSEGCALQLAVNAVGMNKDNIDHWFSTFPELHRHVNCPECGYFNALSTIIGHHLNDWHVWNIDKIAEWVDQLGLTQEELSREEENKDLVEMCL